MAFIENVGRFEIKAGNHTDPGSKSMLIQISDIGYTQPVTANVFTEVHQFNFDDIEQEGPNSISEEQAQEIAKLLRVALHNDMNVIVHCHAGICRSGAVVEAGKYIGFVPTEHMPRIPNSLVKHKLFEALGCAINEETSVFAQEFRDRTWDV